MAAPNIGQSIIRVVNFFVVVLVALILLNLLAQPLTSAFPIAGQNVGAIFGGLWQGIKNITPNLTSAAAGNTPTATPATTTPTVQIADAAVAPPALTVAAGTTFTVINQGLRAHTVTVPANGTFRGVTSAPIGAGQRGTITAPSAAGTYTYYVDNNTSLFATLTVN